MQSEEMGVGVGSGAVMEVSGINNHSGSLEGLQEDVNVLTALHFLPLVDTRKAPKTMIQNIWISSICDPSSPIGI